MGFTDKVRERARQAAEETRSGLSAALPGAEDSGAVGADGGEQSPVPAVGPTATLLVPSPRWEYQTEVLTSVMGRDKLRTGDLDAALERRGDQGWELVSCNLDADLKGSRDGHLLIFKRQAG